MNREYDVIIIGGGPAGVTASIYIRRAGFKVLLLDGIKKSSLQKAEKIENFYGFENPISGEELYQNGINQAKRLGIDVIKKEVISIKYASSISLEYQIITANQGKDEDYKSKFVVLATGANRNSPNIKGIKELEGKGVSYCAVCDAPFFKGKKVAVLGSGEYAIGETEELLPIAKKVLMLTNGEKVIENRLPIDVNQYRIKEVRGDSKISEILFENGSTTKIDGLFIAQGTASSVDFAKKIGAKIENNNVYVNENMETTAPNVYACGDCTGGILQIAKATYEGMKAGFSIIRRLREK